jgi:long-chain acyl-CoA synthetase
VAVISPNKEELLKLAKSKNINGDYEAICKNKELRTLLLIELNNFGKKNGLMGFEQAKNAYL